MNLIHEAGFPVWFVLASGTFALVQAVRWRAGSADGAAVLGAVAATLLCGVLGTAWGAQLAFSGMRELPDPAQQGWIAWIGVKEALCNLDVACAFGIAASLVATVGRRRSAVASAG
ncbi:MAG TPA: hypothetical protein VF334_22475 [Polyangia bacterium]